MDVRVWSMGGPHKRFEAQAAQERRKRRGIEIHAKGSPDVRGERRERLDRYEPPESGARMHAKKVFVSRACRMSCVSSYTLGRGAERRECKIGMVGIDGARASCDGTIRTSITEYNNRV